MDPIFGGNRGQGCHTQGRTTDRNPHSTSSCKNRTRSSKKGYKIKSEKNKKSYSCVSRKKNQSRYAENFSVFLATKKKKETKIKRSEKIGPLRMAATSSQKKIPAGFKSNVATPKKNLFSVTMHTSSRRSKKNCSTQKHSSRTTKN